METNINRMEKTATHINKSIGCTVHECKYHAQEVDYCTLDHIMVTKHEKTADTTKSTDCGSFEAKANLQ